ncbi:MAG: hypothetical protein J7L96_03240 [Bacteroidales bacterium]|nr:hypothetical protein [Bacteroidales bacterium]
MYQIIRAITRAIIFASITVAVFACEEKQTESNPDIQIETNSLGILDIHFVYNIQGLPRKYIKRADLSLAHTADSMYRGEFFRATNVSDAVSKYRFYLPAGEYYYHATIICLAGGDSCSIAHFGEQYGLRMDGGKVEVVVNKLTEVTTQFH